MKLTKIIMLVAFVLLIGLAFAEPITAPFSALAFVGIGLVSISNPKGYALDKELVFQNDGATSYDIALPNATTVYSNDLEIPTLTNGKIAVEIVFPAATAIPATYPLTIKALVGAAANPTGDFDQIIGSWVNETIAAGTDFQWILPEQYSGYKYIRLQFTVATSDLSALIVNAFMHGLA